MKNKRHIFLSAVLALVMVFTIFPVSASAAGLGIFDRLFGGRNQSQTQTQSQYSVRARSDGNYTLLQNGSPVSTTGFVRATINGKNGAYYADKGVINPHYTGAKYGTLNGKTTYWFLNGGVVEENYSGVKGTSKYQWTVRNGEMTAILIKVPQVNQVPDYPTGCEAAASTSLLNFYGTNTSMAEMINAIPRENIVKENGKDYGPSIYQKFVGDPASTYTAGNPGYGAFAPVVTKAMNSVLSKHGSRYKAYDISGTSPSQLYQKVRNGQPVVVWATYNMKTPTQKNSWYVKDASKPNGEYYFEYPRGTHVMVLCGVDDANNTITVEDPYGASYKTFDRSLFESKYALLNQMAIEIR